MFVLWNRHVERVSPERIPSDDLPSSGGGCLSFDKDALPRTLVGCLEHIISECIPNRDESTGISGACGPESGFVEVANP